VRGALGSLDGVEILDLVEANKVFKVKFDPKKTELPKILAALKDAGEPAKKVD